MEVDKLSFNDVRFRDKLHHVRLGTLYLYLVLYKSKVLTAERSRHNHELRYDTFLAQPYECNSFNETSCLWVKSRLFVESF